MLKRRVAEETAAIRARTAEQQSGHAAARLDAAAARDGARLEAGHALVDQGEREGVRRGGEGARRRSARRSRRRSRRRRESAPPPVERGTARRRASSGFIWPVNGPITSPFGSRCLGERRLLVPSGNRHRRARRDPDQGRRGRHGHLRRLARRLRQLDVIDHGNGLATAYGHQSSIARRERRLGRAGPGDRLRRLHGLLLRRAPPLRGARQRRAGEPARLPVGSAATKGAGPRVSGQCKACALTFAARRLMRAHAVVSRQTAGRLRTPGPPALTHAERLREQEDVQAGDQRRHDDRDRGRDAVVDEPAHHVAARVKITSGISANGMPNESTTWLITSVRDGSSADRDHDERGQHRHRAADEQRDLALDEALHHDLTGERSDRRAREARRDQREREERARRAAEQRRERAVRGLERVDVQQARS